MSCMKYQMPWYHPGAMEILKVMNGIGYIVSPIHERSFRRLSIIMLVILARE